MKRILLLTSQYPFGKGESFIATELESVSSLVKIEVIPSVRSKNEILLRSLPSGVERIDIYNSMMKIHEKAYYLMRSLLRISTWEELHMLSKQNRLNYSTIRMLVAFVARGERIMDAVEKLYSALLKSSPQSIVIYSYWMLDTAYAAARLEIKYGCSAFSRAHGGDVYEERNDIGYQPMHTFIIHNLDAIYSVSAKGMNYLKKKNHHDDKLHVAYLGTQDYGYSHVSIKDKPFTIVSCAFMVPVKRIELLVCALSAIQDRQIHWVHFGDGVERCNIEKTIQSSLPYNIKVDLMGDTLHTEVMRYYQENKVHIFINTSSSEGLPVSIMEAISFGIPVIATDVGGIPEIIQDGKNGWLLPSDFPIISLTDKIREMMGMDDATYQNMRIHAREVWEKDFNTNKNHEKFYKNIMR